MLKIKSKKDLLKHFDMLKKIDINDIQQIYVLMKMDVSQEVWEKASKQNLLSFNQQFIQQTRELTFYKNEIKYPHIISYLSNLTHLNLEYNNLTDISAIQQLKNLRILDLSRNEIEDISALESLINLTSLNLYINDITSYKIASPNLEELNIGANRYLCELSLEQCPRLLNLQVNDLRIENINVISPKLFQLRKLEINDNSISKMQHISYFLDLQSLNLDCNKLIKNIEPLKYCTQMRELVLSNTGINEITPLKFLKHLQSLHLNFIDISDIWPVQFMRNLKDLEMLYTQVIDLHPLQYLYQLENVSAFHARIIDISPLSNLVKLQSLAFSNNKITNIEPLIHHKNFRQTYENDEKSPKYNLKDQIAPTTDELAFYNKILSVHSSHKQIRKLLYQNNISKFRASLTQKKNYVSAIFNNQIMMMNKEVDMLMQFIQNSTSYLD
ncbi:leucine-rich_repeat-containing protein [Hexamita inflata]|uniref:Leucine-rich repeat-containing protein n=1 Tax=Hexamita inflata TaxID=28002 RepID=A0AA86N5Y6_9EUKA|nr:leucine-rich repeat-containing protein [Hexamita inflata]